MELVVAVGFEPTKHIANDLKSFPFDLTREYYLGYPTLDIFDILHLIP